MINTAGPNFENLEETAVKLGIKSIRLVRQILTKWKSALLEEELKILADFCQGILKPNEEDSFYTLILSPKLEECDGPFLVKRDMFL